MSRHALSSIIGLVFGCCISLLAAPAVATPFTVGVVNGPGDVQQGSGSGWLAENTGSSTAVTIGTSTFSGESVFTAGTPGMTGGGGQDVPSYASGGLNDLLSDFRYGGSISANLPVVNGVSYSLQLLFFDPSHPAYGPGHRLMDITVGSDTLSAFDVIGTTSGTKAAYVNYSFTASGNSELLKLQSDPSTIDGNTFLSGFSLIATVPEPSSYVLMGLGAVALAVIRRRLSARHARS